LFKAPLRSDGGHAACADDGDDGLPHPPIPGWGVARIVNEKRGITADTAMRLARYFGTTVKLWLNMQVSYELEVAEDRLGSAVMREVLPRTAA